MGAGSCQWTSSYHSMVCTARLTRKPNKAPAMTSTSVCPTVSFNGTGYITFFNPSSPPSASTSTEVICVELLSLTLLGDAANRVLAFVRLGAGEVSMIADGFPDSVLDLSSPSLLQWNRLLESVMLMVFAWLPTSLLTPCPKRKRRGYLQLDISSVYKTLKFKSVPRGTEELGVGDF